MVPTSQEGKRRRTALIVLIVVNVLIIVGAAVAGAVVFHNNQRTTAAQYRITAPSYEFDVPEYWWGKVEVQQNGDEVSIYATGHPDQVLCSLTVEDADTAVAGDIANGVDGQWQLDDTHVLQLWTTRWSLMATLTVMGQPSSVSLTREEAANLIDLSTGGATTLDEMVSVANEQGSDATATPSMDWARDALVPAVSLR